MASWPYSTQRWQRLRKRHLTMFPMCVPCRAVGRITIANTVDHNQAISDGGMAFPGHDGLTSMCVPCHSAKTARGTEAGAVRTDRALRPRRGCDANGNPIDPAHPWNGKSLKAVPLGTAANPRIELVSKGNRNGR